MKKVFVAITLITLFVAFYQLAPYMGVPGRVIIGMLILSPILVLLMVYPIFKYCNPIGHTFDERYYDDMENEMEENSQLTPAMQELNEYSTEKEHTFTE